MKEYYQNLVNEVENKEAKVKYHPADCDCFVGFLKLHQYSCPLVGKPCPIHGNSENCKLKEEKMGCQKCMIISLHSTGNLFHPVKVSTGREIIKQRNDCCSENYSLKKETLKCCETQTNTEEFKKHLPQFVKKTKSLVVDKTNRIRKLRQCFHSPCNSIIQKCPSQSTVREKTEVYKEVKKTRNVSIGTNVTDKWFQPCNPWGHQDPSDKPIQERSREHDKKYSHPETVQKNNQDTDSSIIEVKHKRGFMEIPKTKKKSTFFAPYVYYTSVDSVSNQKIIPNTESKTSELEMTHHTEEEEKPDFPSDSLTASNETVEETSSVKSQSESSGSVFFTPIILQPVDTDRSEERDSDKKPKDEFEKKTYLDNTTQTEVVDTDPKERESLTKEPSHLSEVATKEQSTSMGSSMKISLQENESLSSSITSEKKSQDKSKSLESVSRNYSTILEEIRKSSIITEKVRDEEVQPGPSLLQYQSPVLSTEKSLRNSGSVNILDKEVQPGSSLLKYDSPVLSPQKSSHSKSSEIEPLRKLTDSIPTLDKKLQPGSSLSKYNSPVLSTDNSSGLKSNDTQQIHKLSDSINTLDKKVQPGSSLLTYAPEILSVPKHTQSKNISEDFDKPTQRDKLSTVNHKEVQSSPISSKITIPIDEHKEVSENKDTEFSEKENLIQSCKECETLCKQQSISTSDGESYTKKECSCAETYCNCSIGKSITQPKTIFKESDQITKEKYVESMSQTEKVLTKDEGNNTSFSDLSDLTKIINQVFDKMSNQNLNSCDCKKSSEQEIPKRPVTQNDMGTNLQFKQKVTEDTEPQTHIREKEKIKEPKNSVFYICKVCSKEVTYVHKNTSTDPELTTNEKIKFKECYAKTIKIQKVETPREKPPKTNLNKLPANQKKPEENVKRENISPRAGNIPQKQASSARTGQILYRTPSALNHPFQNTSNQQPPTYNQVKKKPENTNSKSPTKTPKSPRNITNHNKPPTMKKDPPQPNGCDCNKTPSMKTSTQGHSNNTPRVKTNEKPTPNRPPHTDIHPSLPVQHRPGTSEPRRPIPKTTGTSKKPDLTYPVTVCQVWPKELMKTLQDIINKSKEELSHRSATDSSTSKTKRNHESEHEEDVPLEKKIKAEETDKDNCHEHQQTQKKDCFVFGETRNKCCSNLNLKPDCTYNITPRRKETDLSKFSGFVWTPPPSTTHNTLYNPQDRSEKAAKSADALEDKNLRKQKICNSNFNKLTTDKNLKQISTGDLDRFEATTKLFRCTFCKSLTYRKVDWDNITESDIVEFESYPLQRIHSCVEPTNNICIPPCPKQVSSSPENVKNTVGTLEDSESTSTESLIVPGSAESVLEDNTENTYQGYDQYISSDTEDVQNNSNTLTWEVQNIIYEPEEVLESAHTNRITSTRGTNFQSKVLQIWKKKAERKYKKHEDNTK